MTTHGRRSAPLESRTGRDTSDWYRAVERALFPDRPGGPIYTCPNMRAVRTHRSGVKAETEHQAVSTIRPGNDGSPTMEEYQFVCSACTQEIAVNGEMREAILENGCPVCAAAVSTDDFA